MGFVEGGFNFRSECDAFHVHVAFAADLDGVTVDANADAVTDLVFGFLGFGQYDSHFFGLVQDGEGDGMMEFLLCRGGITHDSRFIVTVTGNDAAYFGPFTGEGTGLVEQHGVDFTHEFEGATVLDQDTLLGAQGQSRQHGQRCRHADAGTQITVQYCDGSGGAQGGECYAAQSQGGNHDGVSQAFALVL